MAIGDLPMPRWLPGLQGLPLYLTVCDSHIQPPQNSDRASLPPSLSPTLFIETVSLWNLIERKRACQVQLKYLPRVSKCQSRRKQPGSLLLASELFCCDSCTIAGSTQMSFCSARRKWLTESLFSLGRFPSNYTFGFVSTSPMPVTLLLSPRSYRAASLVHDASLIQTHGQGLCDHFMVTSPISPLSPPSFHSVPTCL